MPAAQKKLLKLFNNLDEQHQEMLLNFAEFLTERSQKIAVVSSEPLEIPRPTTESVIAAIKRLAKTYYMLEQSKLFHETSALMTKHVIQGVAAAEIIDELELLFKRHFEQWRNELEHHKA